MDVKSKKPAIGVGDLFSAMVKNPDVVSSVFAKLTPEQLAQTANQHPELLAQAVGFLTPEVLGRLIQANPDLLAASIQRVDAQVLARCMKEDPERMAAVLRCMDAECLTAALHAEPMILDRMVRGMEPGRFRVFLSRSPHTLAAFLKLAGVRVLVRAVVSNPWLLAGTLVIGGLSLWGLANLLGVG